MKKLTIPPKPKRPRWTPWDPASGEPPRRRGRPTYTPEQRAAADELHRARVRDNYRPVAKKNSPPGSQSKQKPKYNQVDKILARFQMPVYDLARVLGIAPSTIYRWRHPSERGGNDGLVPNYYLAELLLIARREGVVIRARDLEPERISYPPSISIPGKD